MNYKIISKKISTIIDKDSICDDEVYINKLKGTLYYIGKIMLFAYFYSDENDLSKIIELGKENKTLDFWPQTGNFDKSTSFQTSLNNDEKRDITNYLLSLELSCIREISLGELYELLVSKKEKKQMGQVYTPKHIVDYMISSEITKEDVVDNPYIKVIDPACGGGYFLIGVYKKLKEIFTIHYEEIILNNPQVSKELSKGIHRFIIKYNIFGTDVDPFAVYMSTLALALNGGEEKYFNINIEEKDILLFDDKEEDTDKGSNIKNGCFDLVIGNPPYIGHKKIDKEYRKNIAKHYSEVYTDKSDISYCFFKKGYDLLKNDGKLGFITSRYFQEAPSAMKLRKYIRERFSIHTIIDFYGHKVFKNIGISPVIIKCSKVESKKERTHIYKLIEDKVSELGLLNKDFKSFYLKQDNLEDKGWVLATIEEKKLFNKIHNYGDYFLEDISVCNQGVITGCDSAFIVNKDTIKKYRLETDIIKPWIKNSDIYKYQDVNASKYILYTDSIDDIENYKNTINYIEPHVDKLMKRRECAKGIRKWYELQWGRNLNVFNGPKIVFPYKSATNKFSLISREILCSADVYIIKMKEELKEEVPIEYLLAFLNSSLFEFYFKSVAKKVGDKLYDYYPNKIMSLKIRKGENINEIITRVNDIINKSKKLTEHQIDSFRNKNSCNLQKIYNNIKQEINFIDNYFYQTYELTEEDINIVKEYLL